MDAGYWKQRCEAAEDALRRARSRVWVSPERRTGLAVLGDLTPCEALTTVELAQRLGLTNSAALGSLRKLHAVGLVDRSADRGCHYRPIRWRLGHLVVGEGLPT